MLSFSGVSKVNALNFPLKSGISGVSGVVAAEVVMRTESDPPGSCSGVELILELCTFLYCGEQELNRPKTGASSASSVSSSMS